MTRHGMILQHDMPRSAVVVSYQEGEGVGESMRLQTMEAMCATERARTQDEIAITASVGNALERTSSVDFYP